DGTDYTAPGMDYEKNYVQQAFVRQGYGLYLDSIGLSPTAIAIPTVREEFLPEKFNEQKTHNTQQTQQHSVFEQSQPNNDYYFGLG
ncbi:MAG: hypothetical protein WBM62_01905, partial [Crocosphaera sp.]